MKTNKRVLGIVSISLVLLTLIGVLSACSFLEAEQEISNTSIIEVIDNSEINIETIKSEEEVDKNISVKFIDVGQADSCVIVTPNNDVILIDAGEKKDASEIIPELDKYEFEDIDLMILSHPHADHIGGAETLIGK
jgi:beta-lactamase superfamily II metal-dependent hydrolase